MRKIDTNEKQSELGSEIKDSYLSIMVKALVDHFCCLLVTLLSLNRLSLEELNEEKILKCIDNVCFCFGWYCCWCVSNQEEQTFSSKTISQTDGT